MTIIALIFLLVGGISLFFAYKKYQDTKKFIQKAISAEGVVIKVDERMETSTDSDGYTTNVKMYTPVIKFLTQDGKEIVFTSQVSTNNKNAWKVDQKLVVLYDPEDPQKARINKRTNLYFLPIILTIIGLVFMLLGMIMRFAG